MSEYRIKVITKENGKKYYYPQYKVFGLIWACFEDLDNTKLYTSGIESTKRIIDYDIEKEKNKKTISKEYIKYP